MTCTEEEMDLETLDQCTYEARSLNVLSANNLDILSVNTTFQDFLKQYKDFSSRGKRTNIRITCEKTQKDYSTLR